MNDVRRLAVVAGRSLLVVCSLRIVASQMTLHSRRTIATWRPFVALLCTYLISIQTRLMKIAWLSPVQNSLTTTLKLMRTLTSVGMALLLELVLHLPLLACHKRRAVFIPLLLPFVPQQCVQPHLMAFGRVNESRTLYRLFDHRRIARVLLIV